jgi:WD40 repeat protein
MRTGRGLATLVLTLTLQGCLSSSLALHVAPDGRGRAVIISRVYEQALQDFQTVFSVAPEDRKSAEDSMPPPTEEDLSAQFGTPVLLESTELEKTAEGVIRTTVVTFPDITQVHLQFPPVLSLPSSGAFGMSGVSEPPVITFAMRPHENGDRLLIVRMPDDTVENEQNPAGADAQADQAMDRNVRRALNGMAVEFTVETDVPLLRTNAPQRLANSATILNVDVSQVLDNLSEDKISRAMAPGSIQKMLWELGDVPGAVLPTEREVYLEFAVPSSQPSPAQAAARPDTEIFLAPLANKEGHLEIGAPVNITGNAGYDNQPFFTRDGGAVLFTSVRGGTQSDIYRYDIATSRVTQVTSTPESEYSPTITPDGSLSVVRVELDKDRTQRLWQFTAEGREPRLVLESIKPVGYHAWVDDHTVALFVLGQPATLQIADAKTGTARVVASDIGRSIQPIPGRHTISFVQRDPSGDTTRLLVEELNPATGEVTLLTPAVPGGDEADLAWTPDGTLLMARGDVLYGWRRGDGDWKAVAALDRLGLKHVSRIAVSAAGDRIALVGTP